jgi:hypothetical protein
MLTALRLVYVPMGDALGLCNIHQHGSLHAVSDIELSAGIARRKYRAKVSALGATPAAKAPTYSMSLWRGGYGERHVEMEQGYS